MISNFYVIGLQKMATKKKFNDSRSKGEEPIAPSIPSDLVSKMTQRYVTAYESMTGNTL